jgi:hypothetical protein
MRKKTAILKNIKFNKETNTMTFLSYVGMKLNFELKFKENKFKGKLWGDMEGTCYGRKAGIVSTGTVAMYGDYQKTKIPDDVDELYLENGNLNSDTVLLVIQGGPFSKVEKWNFFDAWKEKLHLVYVEQVQSINSTLIPAENNFTMKDAYEESLISAEIIHRVVNHFKNQNKKVIIWGASYASWLLEEYIANYGIESDAMAISVGRLDMEEQVWKGLIEQISYSFTYKNGRKLKELENIHIAHDKTLSYMSASIVKERYTQRLEKSDLSKLVLYQYGKIDKAVGALEKSEIDFLTDKGVEVIGYNANHGQVMSPEKINIAIQKMLEYIIK